MFITLSFWLHMMRFVNNEQVKFGTEQGLLPTLLNNKVSADDNKLLSKKRIVVLILKLFTALIIKHTKSQREAAAHFYQPLIS